MDVACPGFSILFLVLYANLKAELNNINNTRTMADQNNIFLNLICMTQVINRPSSRHTGRRQFTYYVFIIILFFIPAALSFISVFGIFFGLLSTYSSGKLTAFEEAILLIGSNETKIELTISIVSFIILIYIIYLCYRKLADIDYMISTICANGTIESNN